MDAGGEAAAAAATGQNDIGASSSSQDEHEAAGRVEVKVLLGHATHWFEIAVVFQGQTVHEAEEKGDVEPGGQVKHTCSSRMRVRVKSKSVRGGGGEI